MSLKSLSDYNKKRAKKILFRRQKELNKNQQLLNSCNKKDILLYPGTTETMRQHFQQKIKDNQASLYSFKCNHCSTQLINPEPGMRFLSSPPQYSIACPGCAWSGYHRP
jgi:hypothetical protein